jgi:hypothetical protein
MPKKSEIFVNICIDIGKTRSCRTLKKEEAKVLKEETEASGGTVFWYQPANY